MNKPPQSYWQNLEPPMCPNADEVALYKELISTYKPVCLLGMTKELVPFCDYAVDIDPWDIGKPTIKCDWKDIGIFNLHAGIIIGDGILNLMGLDFVNVVLMSCERFVTRVFLRKFSFMKYATHFPADFGSGIVHHTQDGIAIVEFTKMLNIH